MTASLRLPSAAEVDAARANIAGIARRTPLWRIDADMPGTNIWLKLENLQPLGSFKIRAAVNAIKTADLKKLRAGVLSPSAGNFGLGLAWAARDLRVPVTIVAPDGAAPPRQPSWRRLGARVIRVPFADWWQVLQTRRFDGVEGVFFHPVADTAVVAGNATIGAEILEDLAELRRRHRSLWRRRPDQRHRLGRPSGKAWRADHRRGIRDGAASRRGAGRRSAGAMSAMSRAFVDGIGSSEVLDEMWPLVRETVDQAISPLLDEIAAAVRLLAVKHKIIAEGAGAASVAAALSGRAGKGNIVCIVSGGNIDASKLASILNGDVPK